MKCLHKCICMCMWKHVLLRCSLSCCGQADRHMTCTVFPPYVSAIMWLELWGVWQTLPRTWRRQRAVLSLHIHIHIHNHIHPPILCQFSKRSGFPHTQNVVQFGILLALARFLWTFQFAVKSANTSQICKTNPNPSAVFYTLQEGYINKHSLML